MLVAGIVIAVYLLVLLLIAWVSLHPFRTPLFIAPGLLGTPQEEVQFTSADGVPLKGWWVDAESNGTVVVLVHGYMMNRCELTPLAVTLWKEGASCLLLDLRRHGRSGGRKCSLGLKERWDVAAAAKFAKDRKAGCKVVLVGSSMGSAASALAMADDPDLADVLVLDSCYSRLSSAIIGWWRFLGGQALAFLLSPTVAVAMPMAGFNPFRIDVSKAVGALGDTPVLVLHGERDSLALPSEAKRNFEAIQGPKEIVWFPGCGHSEGRWLDPHKYTHSVLEFLRRHGALEERLGVEASSQPKNP